MSGQQSGHSSSFTDLMASLLAVFVLLFVAAQNKRVGTMSTERQLLIKALQGQLQEAGVDTGAVRADPRDPNAVMVVFPESLFFESGKSVMLPSGRRIVEAATPRLVGVLCDGSLRPRVAQIVVEGHTDNTWQGASSKDARRLNLGLSQLRSMDFVSTSTSVLSDSTQLGCYLDLVSASGRGQEDPLPLIPPNHALQRRVLLRIRLHDEVKDTIRVSSQR